MNYYHMTSLDRLNSISKFGLIPKNENNSKLINDTKIKVFFSEGFEGCIALFVDFDIVYNDIKCGNVILENEILANKVMESDNLKSFLGEGVYLQFDGTNIENERNFENGCTSKVILPGELNVCVLKSKNDNNIIFSRFEVIKYMMSKVNPEDIHYYGVFYENSPNFDEATKRIHGKVKRYYSKHFGEIEKYNSDYFLEYIPIVEFADKYL